VAAALAAGAFAACGGADPFAPRASLPNVATTVVVFPLSASVTLPSGLDLYNARAVRPQLSGVQTTFDLALDRAAGGRVVLYAPRRLVVAPGGTPRTGMRVVAGDYAALESAPTDAFAYDSLLTVDFGQVVAVEAQSSVCTTAAPLRAKLVVDSVGASGGLYVRTTVNPNCGFRSFASGIPTF
jgi:hypothetical protein